MEVVGTETPPVRCGDWLTGRNARKAIDGVRAPLRIQPAKIGCPEAVVVVAHSGNAGQIVGASVELSWEPYRLQFEATIDLGLEQLESQRLKPWIRGTARDEFAKPLATHGRFGDKATEDKDAAEVVEKHPKPTSAKEGGYRNNEHGQAVEFAVSGAGCSHGRGQRGHELDPASCICSDLGG